MTAGRLRAFRHDGSGLRLYDEFSGCGGSTQGCSKVPFVHPLLAANHDKTSIASHSANFPGMEHVQADITKVPVTALPYAELFWASPACPAWTDARGKKRDFDHSNQGTLFPTKADTDEKTKRSRALMEEVPRYLGAMVRRGTPVLGGVVENVIQCR